MCPSLDIFQNDIRDADAWANGHLQGKFPATFAETFETAWNENAYFGQSLANTSARTRAASDYAAEIEKKTGDQSLQPMLATKGLEGLNGRLKALALEHPDLDIKELSDDEIDKRALQVSQNSREAAKAMAARDKTFGGKVGGLLGGVAAGATDPVNLVAFSVAAPESLGILGTALAWGGIAAGTQYGIELAGAAYRERVEPGYGGTSESAMNIIGAGLTGAAIGGGLKGVANIWTRVATGAWPRSIRDAGNVVESEANIANTNPFPTLEGTAAHRTAMQKAIDDLVSGRPVDVDDAITTSVLQTYNERLYTVMNPRMEAIRAEESALRIEREGARLPDTMERLSELQLGEVHGNKLQIEAEASKAREKLAGEAQSITAARQALEETKPELDTLRQDVEDLKSEAAKARAKADQSARHHGPRRGTLEQEATALERAFDRKEKELAKVEARTAKKEAAISSREFALPINQKAVEARAASRSEATRNELRKTIGRLAREGYDLKMSREEAQSIADGILAAPDRKTADRAIRALTEDLVNRRMEAQRTAATEQLPFGAQRPQDQHRARAAYHTDDVRKNITALSREIGYDMPKEEAAVIAEGVVKAANDNEALAILDEMMLRPRTLADSLAGTRAAREQISAGMRADRPVEPGTLSELGKELPQQRAIEVRDDPVTNEAVTRNLDRLRAEQGNVEIPMGETIGESGERIPIMRKIEDIAAEWEQRELAAREIEACVGPQQEAAE